MKNFKLMAIALVAMLGFSSCSEDCNHEFIEYDNTKNLVGTWTYLEEGQAEAMVINSDGSFEVTGVMKGGNGSLYEEKGTIKVVNNKVSLVFEGDTDVIEGRLELVAGKSLSIVLNEEYDIRLTYNYCKEDLSDEIVGMWVCHEGLPGVENDMAIKTYSEDGKYTLTTQASSFIDKDVVMAPGDYKIVGDLLFMSVAPQCLAARLTYTPNGTTLGDIMTETLYAPSENGDVYLTSTWLRVKQSLNLAGKAYAYNTAYVTSAKGKDEDFSIMGHIFNIAKIKASDFDVMFGADLFLAEFPNSNTMKHRFHIDGQDTGFDAQIAIEENKVTIDMSVVNPALRKVDMYMFQDADDSQLHMYMPTTSFINYFANMELYALILKGEINQTDEAAIAKVFADMEARVESINVSFVLKALR